MSGKNEKKGIKLINKRSIIIEDSVKIGENVVIYPNNILKGSTIVNDNVTLLPNNIIIDSVINQNTTIEFSHIEKSEIGSNCQVGPYSRLRPNSQIGNNCKVGNFVEIKNSVLGDGSKASHLAYIGDVEIGKNCNIGCGAIFVNYNGKEKNRSIVGDDCFIGSNVNVIAPVSVAPGSYICAGTTLTVDTQKNDFVIGRNKETIKRGYAKKYQKEKK